MSNYPTIISGGKGHIIWVDYCKSAAIFLVVLLHTHCTPSVTHVINSFIMPLFFMVSGFLFSYERNPSYKAFAWKRTRQLIVPYLWINLVAYLAWLLVLRHYGNNAGDSLPWHVPLYGAFCGIPPLLAHDIPLWSLLSFFVVEMIYYPLGNLFRNRTWIVVVVSVAVTGVFYVAVPGSMSHWPLTLGPSIAGLGFYALGNMAKEKFSLEISKGSAINIAALAAIFILAVIYCPTVNFYICDYGNYILYLLSSLAGSVLVIFISIMISRLGSCRLVAFISESTLIVCGFHLLVFAAIKGVMLIGLGVGPERLTDGFLPGFLFATASFMISLALAWIIRRYFRFSVDK